MKIQYMDAKSVGNALKKLMAKYEEFYWSVAWMTETSLLDELVTHKKKIKQFVVGIDFVQTSPEALKRLSKVRSVKVSTGHEGRTFHPKVYLFKAGDKCAAIVGSSNFTAGGVKSNDEASLFLQGSVDEAPFSDIEKSVADWWASGSEISPQFLAAYQLRWNASKRSREDLSRALRIRVPTSDAKHPGLQQMSWRDYLGELEIAQRPNIDGRLAVLKKARELFASAESFAAMEILERKAIAGFIGKNEVEEESAVQGLDWGWFGSMKGAGVFKNRVNEGDEHISFALEHIPVIGAIDEADYLAFAGEYVKAYDNSPRVGGLPTASRLLAMKRPDYFVCVDRKNHVRLAADFGFKQSQLNLESYWDLVVQPVIESSWWNVRRPSGLNGRTWDARAAMLDVIYYDWT